MPARRVNPSFRFWRKVNFDGPTVRAELGPCWLWTAHIDDDGYGTFNPTHARPVKAHHWSYEHLIGPIDAETLDHLCRVKHCVKPWHLDPCSFGENVLRGGNPPARNARKTECPRGHPLSGDNLRIYGGRRYCHICMLERDRRNHPERFRH